MSWCSKGTPEIFVVRHALTCAPEGCRLASPSLLPANATSVLSAAPDAAAPAPVAHVNPLRAQRHSATAVLSGWINGNTPWLPLLPEQPWLVRCTGASPRRRAVDLKNLGQAVLNLGPQAAAVLADELHPRAAIGRTPTRCSASFPGSTRPAHTAKTLADKLPYNPAQISRLTLCNSRCAGALSLVLTAVVIGNRAIQVEYSCGVQHDWRSDHYCAPPAMAMAGL